MQRIPDQRAALWADAGTGRPRRLLRSVAGAAAAAWLAGCSLMPAYERPAAPVPERFPVATAAAGEALIAELGWREVFTDPALRAVIDRALSQNRDLRSAALSIDKARALLQVQSAKLAPTVSAGASALAQRLPAELSGTGQALVSEQYSATLGIAAWEIDLFGRLRSLREQALQTFLATESARTATQISLVAQVAGAWLAFARDQDLLTLATRTLEARRETLGLTERRAQIGMETELAVQQARTGVESARVDVATYAAQLALDRNALDLLVGAPVEDALLPASLAGIETGVFGGRTTLPAGLPSSLLERRPDIVQAERQLQAANASIGAARAAFFPTISLTAAAGLGSASLRDLVGAGSGKWSFAPSLSVPIFDAGANRANLASVQADRDIAVATYEKSIQTAFREVSDALVTQASMGERIAAQQALVDASRQALTLAEARFQRGLDSYLATLDAQRTLYTAQQALITLQQARAANLVTLYKVLGGGWRG